jgi:hypothetical protein
MPYEMRALDVKFLRWDNSLLHRGAIAIQITPFSNRSPDHFFEHRNQRDNQAELCQLKKFCLSSERDHVFRQFTAGNYVP